MENDSVIKGELHSVLEWPERNKPLALLHEAAEITVEKGDLFTGMGGWLPDGFKCLSRGRRKMHPFALSSGPSLLSWMV